MSFQIQLTKQFKKQYKKLTGVEQSSIDKKLAQLMIDPWHPSLRIKKIQGTEEFEISVNRDIRIALVFEGDTIIILLDVDHHDRLLNRRTR